MKFLVLMFALAAAQEDFRENVNNNRGIDTYGAPAAPSLDTFSNQPQPAVDVQTGSWETVPTQGFSTVPIGNNWKQTGPRLHINPPPTVWNPLFIPQPHVPNPVAAHSLFNTKNLLIASMAALSIWVMISVVLPLMKLSWATDWLATIVGNILPSKEQVVAKGRSLAEVNSVARTVFQAIDKYNLLNE